MKIKKCSLLLLSLLLFLPLFLTNFIAPNFALADSSSTSKKIVGYFPSWGIYGRNYQVADIDASKLTHLNYAFADICWNGRHGNPSTHPDNPNKQTWPCKESSVPLQNKDVPDGTLVLGEPWADVNKSFPGSGTTWEDCDKYARCGNFGELKRLKAKYPHLKTLISVGGWTWSNRFSDMAADEKTRKVFAESTVAFIREYGFDGVDLDWEYPGVETIPEGSYRPEDKQNFTLLLQDVRNALDKASSEDGKSYLLTIASGASQRYADHTELKKISQIVDWINIMTYDFHGGWEATSNHNAALYKDPQDPAADTKYYVDGAVEIYKNEGVPADKIVLGVPFYGRGWKSCGKDNNGQYQPCTPGNDGKLASKGTWDDYSTGDTGIYDYGDLAANYVNKNGFVRYWNDNAKVPYLYNENTGTFISYDDNESMKHKTDYIKAKDLGGAMFWELSGDCRKSSKYDCNGPKLLDTLVTELLGGPIQQKDNEPPTTVKNIVVTNKNANFVQLSWTASTDNVGVTEYEVRSEKEKWTTTTNNITIKSLAPNTEYVFSIIAKDAAGNQSQPSSITVKTDDSNTSPPDGAENVIFAVTSNWGNGYNFSITIKNTGTTPIKNWNLEFDYNGNLTQFWDSKLIRKEKDHYVITNAGWNSEIPPGGSVTIGGVGTGTVADMLNPVIQTN
ncbi:glycosyl hydrolase family 18 protein [Bacillus cytotoxicus]|uniref:glycosyl hydrolase family 18 protein n=1 Tax=Bacillus cytotoxicus TaxID=580165 RepID=UPI000864511B|nr:glycosyl hydrolase family 18 protein [Bacillus cytotoxicus]AWC27363.1 chitinase [Bacillus cytotoxicus]AWC41263.1 chitinase [Bacillus cytotoxicus]AWC49194.1 chitinase [Bacillus cytotoxicus]AWC51429.1 chitinase [Bacillus cytotoxicus]AWC55558.1 chitinase [Bacillus cytotoxicus]